MSFLETKHSSWNQPSESLKSGQDFQNILITPPVLQPATVT